MGDHDQCAECGISIYKTTNQYPIDNRTCHWICKVCQYDCMKELQKYRMGDSKLSVAEENSRRMKQ